MQALGHALTGSWRIAFLLPSLLSGLLTLALVFDLARRLHGRKVAWIAAATLLFTLHFTFQANGTHVAKTIGKGVIDPSVVQRRIALPSAMFPEVGAAGELFFSRRHIELDPYLFRGETRGVLTRLSATTDCNVHAGAGTVPTFILEDTPSAG